MTDETGQVTKEVAEAAAAPAFTPLQRMKNIMGGSAGNFVEWFDWFAYASFQIYFARQFFPSDNQTTALMLSSLTFGLSFLARPLGAFLMGVYADKKGRKAALTMSVTMMCAGSLLIALTPTYGTIGIAAPILLFIARIIQGLSVGGEYGASATYVSEMAGKGNRGFWSGFLYVTLIAGQLAAVLLQVLLQNVMSEEALTEWGWRIPFVIGALLAVVVFWIRRGIHETESFTKTADAVAERGKTMMLFTKYPKETLAILLLTAGGGTGFYIYTSYMKDFLVNSAAGPAGEGFSKPDAALISTGTLFAFMLFQPIIGAISDKIGRKPTLMASFGLGALTAYPIMVGIMNATDVFSAFMLILLPLLILSGYTSLSAIIKAELFPAHVRALGVAVPYAIAQALFGGQAGTYALAFKRSGNEALGFWFIAGILAVGFVVVTLMRDTQKHSLITEG
jgi:MHS family alpha-ketoglutarate permease-like MFS transporter